MKIAVTGGTGFIGQYVVSLLVSKGVDVIVIGTSVEKAKALSWYSSVDFIELDINDVTGNDIAERIASADKLIHLAWSGLPNYKDLFHFEINLPNQYRFLKQLVTLGITDIIVTGTCFEYGMKEGALDASLPSDPQNPYAIAKDTLRKFLQQLKTQHSFRLKWLRLFYMYGPGQSEKSILSLLEKALQNGDEEFKMSGGEQLRDYLPVTDVAAEIVSFALDDEKDGIYNVCSGTPISINKLVEAYLNRSNKTIKLNKGYYPYPDYEPMAFWGVK